METQEIICRLCLNICENFEAIEENMKGILDIVLPKIIDLAGIQKPVMCTGCSVMLIKCFDFKAQCLNTHDYLVPFINNEEMKLDLKNVYLRKNENGTGVLEDEDICGFCMSRVDSCYDIPLDAEEEGVMLNKMIKQCFPELDLSIIKEPVICEPCHGSLEMCFHFVTNCLIVAEKIRKYCETLDINSKDQIELSKLLPVIIKDKSQVEKQFCEDTRNPSEREIGKGGDIIKLEQMFSEDGEVVNEYVKNKNEGFIEFNDQEVNAEQQFMPNNMSACEEDNNKLGSIKGEEILCEENKTKHNEENFVEMEDQECLVNEEIEIKTDEHDFNRFVNGIVFPQSEVILRLQRREKCVMPNLEGDLLELHVKRSLMKKNSVHQRSEINVYNCDLCSFQTKKKVLLKRHSLVHKDSSEILIYKCFSCSFQTKLKDSLRKHMLIHKDPSEVTMYKCDSCSYQTRIERNLKRHLLVHKDPSEVTMYKCDSCSFQTRHENVLKAHSLVQHKDPLEATMYKCFSCSFQTKLKDSLRKHMLIHKDPSEVTMYKCDSCSYQTRIERNLKRHLLVHKDPSEVTMYKCDSCSYQTRHENVLKAHASVQHKDPLEATMYKCDSCSFETIHRRSLKSHSLKHKDPSEITMYKCDSCGFQTKRKGGLKIHLLTHKVPLEVRVYKCDSCSFQSKRKHDLKRHLLVQKDKIHKDKIKMYKCDSCYFQTKHKFSLNNHLLSHKDLSEVTVYKCDSCSFQTRIKTDIKQHLLVNKDHSEITMYKCNSCSFQTKRISSIKIHLNNVKCDSCSYQSVHNDWLRKHLGSVR